MKNLNNKLQDVKKQMKGFYGGIAIIALISSASISHAMLMDEDIETKHFLIKSNQHNEYLFSLGKSGNRYVLGTPEKKLADVFTFERDKNGVRIKNNHNEYLYDSNYYEWGCGEKYLLADHWTFSSFEMCPVGDLINTYYFTSTKSGEFLYLSDKTRTGWVSGGYRIAQSSPNHTKGVYFTLEPLEGVEIIEAPSSTTYSNFVGSSALNEDKVWPSTKVNNSSQASAINSNDKDKVTCYQMAKDDHDQRRLEQHIDIALANDNLSLHHQIEIVNISDEQEDRHLALSVARALNHDNIR